MRFHLFKITEKQPRYQENPNFSGVGNPEPDFTVAVTDASAVVAAAGAIDFPHDVPARKTRVKSHSIVILTASAEHVHHTAYISAPCFANFIVLPVYKGVQGVVGYVGWSRRRVKRYGDVFEGPGASTEDRGRPGGCAGGAVDGDAVWFRWKEQAL